VIITFQRHNCIYSASASLAMQSTIIDRGILSVCPSVHPSCSSISVQTNEDTIVQFSASGRTILLVSEEVKSIRIFARDHPSGGRKIEALLCR